MKIKLSNLPPFIKGYVLCAIWETDENPPSGEYPESRAEEILNNKISFSDLFQMIHDCVLFQIENEELLQGDPEQNGHDFWLSRSRSGSGFCDRKYRGADTLDKAAAGFGEFNLFFN